jgi:hypothetical protein
MVSSRAAASSDMMVLFMFPKEFFTINLLYKMGGFVLQ